MAESRDDLIEFLDRTLAARDFDDYGPMGLQVHGADRVDLTITAVSASRELFELAADARAQLVVVHHGLLWDGDSRVIDPLLRDRLKPLFEHDINLAAYHLALDAHPELGNNALIVRGLGLEAEPTAFALSRGRAIGRIGRASEDLGTDELLARIATEIGPPNAAFMNGPAVVARVAVCSGGGAGFLREAAALGCDALVTGDMSEPAEMLSRELGIHFMAAGHYATEVFGVRALADLINRERSSEARFVDLPTIA